MQLPHFQYLAPPSGCHQPQPFAADVALVAVALVAVAAVAGHHSVLLAAVVVGHQPVALASVAVVAVHQQSVSVVAAVVGACHQLASPHQLEAADAYHHVVGLAAWHLAAVALLQVEAAAAANHHVVGLAA